MQRLKTRAQFQAVLAAGTLARTPHFALHHLAHRPTPAQPAGASAPRADDHRERASAAPSAALSAQRPPKLLFPTPGPWLGAMVPKRWARRAVTRNAIRRQVYAVSQEHGLPALACVVRLRASFDRAEFVSATSDRLRAAVRAELTELFHRAVQLAQRNATSQEQRA